MGKQKHGVAKCRLACSVRAHSCACPNNNNQTERNKTMKQKKLQDAIKGMQVKNWEIREDSTGKHVVYVRFIPKSPNLEVSVKED